jgi:hypothetical protein
MTLVARASFLIIFSGFFLGTVVVAAPQPTDRHLWVTLDVDGERFDAVVSRADSVEYLLKFVKGDAAPRALVAEVAIAKAGDRKWQLLPDSIRFVQRDEVTRCADRLSSIQGAKSLACFETARIVRVKDCGTGLSTELDACVPLRGVYAGRSPY